MGLENTIQGFAMKAVEGVVIKLPENMDKLGGNIKIPPSKGGLTTSPPLSKNSKVNALLKGTVNRIPPPEVIKKRICDSPTAEGASLNYNSFKNGMVKSKKLLEALNKQIEKLEKLIAQIRGALETISTFLDIISTAIQVARGLITGFDAALASQVVPYINGYTVNELGNTKEKTKKKIEKYSLVIKGINIIIKIIIPLLEGFEKQLADIKGAYNGVKSLINITEETMDGCLRENLITQIEPSESTEGLGLDELVDIYNNGSGGLIKIQEYETNSTKETVRYTVKTIPTEEFEN